MESSNFFSLLLSFEWMGEKGFRRRMGREMSGETQGEQTEIVSICNAVRPHSSENRSWDSHYTNPYRRRTDQHTTEYIYVWKYCNRYDYYFYTNCLARGVSLTHGELLMLFGKMGLLSLHYPYPGRDHILCWVYVRLLKYRYVWFKEYLHIYNAHIYVLCKINKDDVSDKCIFSVYSGYKKEAIL